MKTHDLINALSTDLPAVKRLPGRTQRFLKILVLLFAGVSFEFLFFSLRSHLQVEVRHFSFIFSSCILLGGALGGAYLLAILQVPSFEKKGSYFYPFFAAFLLSAFYLIKAFIDHDFQVGLSASGRACSLDILILSLLPQIGIFFYLRKGAATEPSKLGLNVGLCGAFAGAFALQYSCPSSVATHLLVWHLLLPSLILGLSGVFLGRKTLKW